MDNYLLFSKLCCRWWWRRILSSILNDTLHLVKTVCCSSLNNINETYFVKFLSNFKALNFYLFGSVGFKVYWFFP